MKRTTAPPSRSTWACELKFVPVLKKFFLVESRSTWACELKSVSVLYRKNSLLSRSTWACELKLQCKKSAVKCLGHAPRERVSWNKISAFNCSFVKPSRSTWACELKLFLNPFFHPFQSSRSTWACELKFGIYISLSKNSNVTLHVSVWVEMHI